MSEIHPKHHLQYLVDGDVRVPVTAVSLDDSPRWSRQLRGAPLPHRRARQ